MQRRQVFSALAGSVLLSAGVRESAAQQEQPDSAASHTKWVEQVLLRVLTIKPGMTRKQLTELFTTEGGLATRAQRTYVYRECSLFKISVNFKASDDSGDDAWIREEENDVIVKVSDPYLQFSIRD